jgi:hypothetical protein
MWSIQNASNERWTIHSGQSNPSHMVGLEGIRSCGAKMIPRCLTLLFWPVSHLKHGGRKFHMAASLCGNNGRSWGNGSGRSAPNYSCGTGMTVIQESLCVRWRCLWSLQRRGSTSSLNESTEEFSLLLITALSFYLLNVDNAMENA